MYKSSEIFYFSSFVERKLTRIDFLAAILANKLASFANKAVALLQGFFALHARKASVVVNSSSNGHCSAGNILRARATFPQRNLFAGRNLILHRWSSGNRLCMLSIDALRTNCMFRIIAHKGFIFPENALTSPTFVAFRMHTLFPKLQQRSLDWFSTHVARAELADADTRLWIHRIFVHRVRIRCLEQFDLIPNKASFTARLLPLSGGHGALCRLPRVPAALAFGAVLFHSEASANSNHLRARRASVALGVVMSHRPKASIASHVHHLARNVLRAFLAREPS